MPIDDRLYRVVRQVIPDDSVAIDDSLGPDTYDRWDSITSLNLMFMVEQEFDVVFASNTFMALQTVGDIRAYLERAAT